MVPLGPALKEGEINYVSYRVQVVVPTGIAVEEIIQELNKVGKVVEVAVDDVISSEGKSYNAHFSTNSRYAFYLEFETLEKALDLTDEIIIRNRKVWLNHTATLFCATCGEIGHNEKGHAKLKAKREECRKKAEPIGKRRRKKKGSAS
ncbi:unnamed protein product [Blepharisma stoltei]|uniref:Uncharacterized protein n=1 Tax=Blepharisma stoltei TaxID=1481888 RepID=A0AAU9K6Q8_9CILI|nr:unnamed protein product [Blepharisma stoltei]